MALNPQVFQVYTGLRKLKFSYSIPYTEQGEFPRIKYNMQFPSYVEASCSNTVIHQIPRTEDVFYHSWSEGT
jgi:hypothetical protein